MSLFFDDMLSYIFLAAVVFALLIVPALLTAYNLLILVKKLSEKRFFVKSARFFDFITLCYGYMLLMGWILGICGEKEWYEPIILGGGNPGNHIPLSFDNGSAFFVFTVPAIASLLVMLNVKRRLPPLVSVIMIAVILPANAYLFALVIQLTGPSEPASEFGGYYLPPLVYAVNFLLVTVRALRKEISRQLEYLAHNKDKETGISHKLYNMLDSTYKWVIAGFVMLLPIIAVMTIIFILTGQGADGMIKAFTETADWTFSRETPPPPEYYQGHYLCTVAAGGHRKIVRPTRYGIRRGERIIVNRQLCIANAFEDMLMEKTPRFHKAVRSFYDKHGYPVSKIITTKTRADTVYILMKPLELLFIIALYLFDADPESRIAVQYTGKKINAQENSHAPV